MTAASTQMLLSHIGNNTLCCKLGCFFGSIIKRTWNIVAQYHSLQVSSWFEQDIIVPLIALNVLSSKQLLDTARCYSRTLVIDIAMCYSAASNFDTNETYVQVFTGAISMMMGDTGIDITNQFVNTIWHTTQRCQELYNWICYDVWKTIASLIKTLFSFFCIDIWSNEI